MHLPFPFNSLPSSASLNSLLTLFPLLIWLSSRIPCSFLVAKPPLTIPPLSHLLLVPNPSSPVAPPSDAPIYLGLFVRLRMFPSSPL